MTMTMTMTTTTRSSSSRRVPTRLLLKAASIAGCATVGSLLVFPTFSSTRTSRQIQEIVRSSSPMAFQSGRTLLRVEENNAADPNILHVSSDTHDDTTSTTNSRRQLYDPDGDQVDDRALLLSAVHLRSLLLGRSLDSNSAADNAEAAAQEEGATEEDEDADADADADAASQRRLENGEEDNKKDGGEHRNVLLLGDSVSRMVVAAACRDDLAFQDLSANDSLYSWDRNKVFDDYFGELTTLVCNVGVGETDSNKLGYIHTFGSLSDGPYFKVRNQAANTPDCEDNPNCKTPQRICRAIEEYTQQEGPPTHVILAIMLWDISLYPDRLDDIGINELSAEWKKSILDRLDDVKGCLPDRSNTVVSIQTTPSAPNPRYKIMYSLNDQIRQIVKEKEDICLVDYDCAVHACGPDGIPPNYSYEDEDGSLWPAKDAIDTKIKPLFRDGSHPSYVPAFHHSQHLLHSRTESANGCLGVATAPYSQERPIEASAEWFHEHGHESARRE